MVESSFIDPHLHTVFHQLVQVVKHTVGRKWDVALCASHDFHFHTTFGSLAQTFLQFAVQCEVGIHQFDAVAGGIDGGEIELTDNLIRGAWFAVDDAHHLRPFGACGVGLQSGDIVGTIDTTVIFGTGNLFARHFFPGIYKDALQLIHRSTLDATMHITPFTHHFRTFYIIVSHVHTTRIGCLAVDNHNLAVVA